MNDKDKPTKEEIAAGDNSTDGHDDDHGHDDHGNMIGKFMAVFGCLVVLTIISFAVGSSEFFMGQVPWVGRTAMFAVSCAKALLVILFFMHLKWEANWKYVLTIPASFMSLFLLIALIPDIGLRGHWYSWERQLHSATPVESADHAHDEDDAHHEESGHAH